MKKFYDYIIYEDGTVVGKRGNKLKTTTFKSGTKYYTLYIEGKVYQTPARRLIYQTFNPDIDMKDYIVYSKNKDSIALEDLYIVNRTADKPHRYTNMRTKQEIFDRMNSHLANENIPLFNELRWVLGERR